MNKGLKWISVISSIGMFVVLIMGAIVTKTGSGNGCGNTWPLCHGQFAPLNSMESFIEYSHRAVSGLVGLIVIVLSVWAWRKLSHVRGVKFFAFSGVFFVVLQGLLGAAAVVWGQSSAVMALHFGFSLTAFASVLLLTILVFKGNPKGNRVRSQPWVPISATMRNAIWAVAIYCYVVVYIGAYVRHTSSGLGCATWPSCNGSWIPDLTGTTGIHFAHRVAAFLFLLAAIWLFLAVRNHYRQRKDLYYGSMLALILTVMQILSGGYVVVARLQLVPSLLHNTIISCLFGVVCYLCFQSLVREDHVAEASAEREAMHG